MRLKSIPKRCMNPTITFDSMEATFQDLIQDLSKKVKSLDLIEGLRYYHQSFQSKFFNTELTGSILLTIWNDKISGYEDFFQAKLQNIFGTNLKKDRYNTFIIVFDPPLYCFTTHDPFKYLNKKSVDKKLLLFQKGLKELFDLNNLPILYPF